MRSSHFAGPPVAPWRDGSGQGAIVYCPECGHQNPAGNKFCGMCGEHLPERTANPSPEKRRTAEMRTEDVVRAAQERRERIAEHDPEPVRSDLRHREPVDAVVREPEVRREPVMVTMPPKPVREVTREELPRESELPAAVNDFYASRRVETASEEPTTLSGPSFLGLSGSGNGSSYSYLYEDEQPSSHAGTLVFLLVLAILAGVIYWKWQPLHDYVVNTALAHSNTGKPAPTEGTATDSTGAASAQNTQPTSSDKANSPNGMPQQDNAAASSDQKSDQPKTETGQPKVEAAPADKDNTDKTSTPKDERPRSEVGRSSRFQDKGKNDEASDADSEAENEKPSAQRTKPQPAGAELVNSGERYLYGRGVPRNCSQAVSSFHSAAKQDNPTAMAHLGSLYATGQCVPFNRVQAYQWYSRALAADRGNTYIEHNLNMLWREMSSDERAQATQRKMF